MVAARQLRELVEVLAVSSLSIEFRKEDVAFVVQILCRSLDTFSCNVLCVMSLISALSDWCSTPGRRFMCSICSKIALLCGKVNFSTGLTGFIDSSWFFVISVFCFVIVRFYWHNCCCQG